MKKFFAYLILCSLLIMPISPLLAAADSVSFFEAIGNLSTIEDYKLIQAFYGDAELEEFGDHLSAKYRISISSVADGGNRTDSFNRLSAYIKFTNHNEATDSTPFKTMTVQANGEVITKNQQDIYFKLNNFNISLKEPIPFAVLDIENAMSMADLYRGTWFHTSANELATDELDVEIIDVKQYIDLEEQLKEDPKEAIMGLAELVLQDSNSSSSEEQIDNFLDGIELILETKLFTERDIVAGRNTNFKFFNLNKASIINLMSKAAELIDENMTAGDKTMIRAALSKVSLSGIYRIDDIHEVIDNLLIRFRLKDIDALKNLELNYRYKLSDLNKENSVKAPTVYEEWSMPSSQFDPGMFEEEEF